MDLARRPYCCDCVWYEASGELAQVCSNPDALLLSRLVVGDAVGPVAILATVPRFSEALCGLEGRWFKRRE